MARQPSGRPTISGPDKHGLYHCYVPTGELYTDGSPKRKHIKRRDKTVVAAAVDEYMDRLRKHLATSPKTETYGEWLDHWLENIIRAQVDLDDKSHNTYVDYEKVVRVHLKPALGGYRLQGRKDLLQPEHHEQLYSRLARAGKAKAYIVKIHAIARRSQVEAMRRQRADRVPALMMDQPKIKRRKGQASTQQLRSLNLNEAMAVMTEALTDRDGLAARWALGILQGYRQGEVLGMRWWQVILDPDHADDLPRILPGQQLQRRTWQHGCTDPVDCVRSRAKRLCKTDACPIKYHHGCENPRRCKKLDHLCPQRQRDPDRRCARHTRTTYCQPCPADCAAHASTCPQRTGGGLVDQDLKTEASEQAIELADAVVELLRRHREQQIRDLPRAATFDENSYVFVNSRGRPFNPRADWGNWQALLKRAGVEERPLHGARHSSSTFLQATGADLKMVQQVLRHANLKTSATYGTLIDGARRDALNRMAALLVDGDLTKILGARKVA